MVLTALFLLKDFIARKFGTQSPLFVTHFELLYPLVVSIAFFSLFESYAWSIRKTVDLKFFARSGVSHFCFLLLVLYIYNIITLETFFTLYSFIYVPSVVILLFYLIKTGNFPINFSISNVTRRIYKRMLAFGALIFSSSLLNIISRAIDVIFLASQSTGWSQRCQRVFLWFLHDQYHGSAAAKHYGHCHAHHCAGMERQRHRQIENLYHKSSLNLLIVGMAIWGVIFLNMDRCHSLPGRRICADENHFCHHGLRKTDRPWEPVPIRRFCC